MKRISKFSLLLSLAGMSSCHQMHLIKAVNTKEAPQAIGPYSQAIHVDNMIYCSGQIGLNPLTGAFAGDDITSQTRQALDNIKAVLQAGNSDMEHVVKVTIYLKDLADFGKVNDIYKDYFPDVKPARSTVQVARLPKEALIEIDCIATVNMLK
jgi:2-iminobutanoate/2-iminopropanoate deaminase